MLQQSFLLPDDAAKQRLNLPPTNVASVPQRSPFRYPGGKTWFIPAMRKWLEHQAQKPQVLVEPFAGGASVALAAVCENRVEHAVLIEIDPAVSAVWHVIVNGQAPDLANQLLAFELNHTSLEQTLSTTAATPLDLAFQTILKNRTHHGGILANGAGYIKTGENGKGLHSRWYPQTLAKRLQGLHAIRQRLTLFTGDAIECSASYWRDPHAVFFVDPPYTAGGKNAGKRLYNHSKLDHPALFDMCAQLSGSFVMTYDNTQEVKTLAQTHHFETRLIAMKNTHHAAMTELIIGHDLAWL